MPLENPQILLDQLAMRRRRTVGWLAGVNLTVAVLLAVLVYQVLATSRQSFAAQAEQVAKSLASIAQVGVGSELGRVDAVLRSTASELPRLFADDPGNHAVINSMLESRLGLLKGVSALRLADAKGLVRFGNDLPKEPVSVYERDYFKQASTHFGDESMVVGPLQSKVSGHWVLALVRPIFVKGNFQGILYATFTTDHFKNVFDQYGISEQDAVTMRRDDLRLVARRAPGSAIKGDIGSVSVSDELRAALANDPEKGSFVSRVAVDGVIRTTAYRAVEGWPFTILAGISNDRYFAAWSREAWTVSLLALLAWVLVAVTTLAVYVASGRNAVAMQALAAQTLRTRALLRVAGDGIHILNTDGELVEMSDSFAEMLRSTRENLLGRHVSQWV